MTSLPSESVLPKRWGLIYAQCSAPNSFAGACTDIGSLAYGPSRMVRWALRKLQCEHTLKVASRPLLEFQSSPGACTAAFTAPLFTAFFKAA